MQHELPACDDVWRRFFRPWYREGDVERRRHAATKPDAERVFEAGTPSGAVSPLTDAGVERVNVQLESMRKAALEDWPTYLDVRAPIGLEWIGAFDQHWTRERVGEVLDAADPTDFSNEVVVLSCELGIVIGDVFRTACPQLEWLLDWPYWESCLLDVPTGYVINVFDWAIARLSEYGIADGYAAKVGRAIELVRTGWCG